MGWLWVDNAVVTYVDGVQVQKITYSEDGLPSCRLSMHDSKDLDATGAYTLMNELYNVLFVSGSEKFPLELDYVRIWQGTGIVELPPEPEEAPAVDVDANDFWYYYGTDDYGDNIVEINEENYYIVLEGQELWEQLSDERKAEINALFVANGQPPYDELLAAAIAFEAGESEEENPETGATTVLPIALMAAMFVSGTVLVKSRKRKENA
jgi:LPXTG-motif cell wall-anchored protein